MNLSHSLKESIIELQKKYPERRSALIPALHLAQEEIGYLPIEVQAEIAELFDLATNEVHAVVCFYDMFFEHPVGRHVIHVCKNLSCMLRGSDKIIQGLCQKLNIQPGETTADGEFTLIPSECLAACDRAPMALMDDQVVGPLTEDNLNDFIEDAKKCTKSS